jgi:tRNA-2-methylthio-N6-dimethylallyladenosine synthase
MNKDLDKFFGPSIKEARKRRGEKTNYTEFSLRKELENFGQGKKFLITTYGCQGNLADSEKMAGILMKMGYTQAEGKAMPM